MTTLTVHNAEIKTATVEVKTLTISGKQVTLAVFRQLIDEPLIADDGTLNGVPWGTVNYHPDKCADTNPHLHVVWQRGTELRRSMISAQPVFPRDERYDGNPTFWSTTTDELYSACIHHWLSTGNRCYWQGGLFNLFNRTLKVDLNRTGYLTTIEAPYDQERYVKDLEDFSFAQKGTGVRVGVTVESATKEALLAEVQYRAAVKDLEKAREGGNRHYPNHHWCHCAPCYEPKMADALTNRDARLAELATHCGPTSLADRWAAYMDEVTAEAATRKRWRDEESERRQRHTDVRKALADLPQLFIAV